MITLRGDYINSVSDTYKNQYALSDDTPVFEDFLNMDGDGYQMNGQALYTKTFDKWRFHSEIIFTMILANIE